MLSLSLIKFLQCPVCEVTFAAFWNVTRTSSLLGRGRCQEFELNCNFSFSTNNFLSNQSFSKQIINSIRINGIWGYWKISIVKNEQRPFIGATISFSISLSVELGNYIFFFSPHNFINSYIKTLGIQFIFRVDAKIGFSFMP